MKRLVLLTDGLVASGFIVPWLQFTLQGFVACMTAYETLVFKSSTVLALNFALWASLWLLLALPLARLVL